MTTHPLLVAFTALEIVVVLAVLAIFVIVLIRRLDGVARTLGRLTFGVRAVEKQLEAFPRSVGRTNHLLERVAAESVDVAERAERAAG